VSNPVFVRTTCRFRIIDGWCVFHRVINICSGRGPPAGSSSDTSPSITSVTGCTNEGGDEQPCIIIEGPSTEDARDVPEDSALLNTSWCRLSQTSFIRRSSGWASSSTCLTTVRLLSRTRLTPLLSTASSKTSSRLSNSVYRWSAASASRFRLHSSQGLQLLALVLRCFVSPLGDQVCFLLWREPVFIIPRLASMLYRLSV
jgi:hypothetical protein